LTLLREKAVKMLITLMQLSRLMNNKAQLVLNLTFMSCWEGDRKSPRFVFVSCFQIASFEESKVFFRVRERESDEFIIYNFVVTFIQSSSEKGREEKLDM